MKTPEQLADECERLCRMLAFPNANLVALLTEAVAEAVRGERERCARVADDMAADLLRQAAEIDADDCIGAGDNCREHAEACESVAALIRAGGVTP